MGYSFHEKRKTMIAVLDVAGVIKGISIHRNLWYKLKPSILAASSRSLGKSLNEDDRRRIASGNESTAYGILRANKLLPNANLLAISRRERNNNT